jgi:hypothetical protein
VSRECSLNPEAEVTTPLSRLIRANRHLCIYCNGQDRLWLGVLTLSRSSAESCEFLYDSNVMDGIVIIMRLLFCPGGRFRLCGLLGGGIARMHAIIKLEVGHVIIKQLTLNHSFFRIEAHDKNASIILVKSLV